jgi:uncharacterized protein YjbJ (UPF0337 family)
VTFCHVRHRCNHFWDAHCCGHGETSQRVAQLLGAIEAPKVSRDFIRKWSDDDMDKDRIAGMAKEAKGAIKETTGKVVGDAKLTAEGKADKAEGKVQNAIGGLKDAMKE